MSLLRHGQSFSRASSPHEKRREKERERKAQRKRIDHLNSKRGNRDVRFLTKASLYFALEIHGHLGRTGIKDDTRPITWPRRSPVGRERLGNRADPWDEGVGKKRKEERGNWADCGGNGVEEYVNIARYPLYAKA